jgi:hypothetical protein
MAVRSACLREKTPNPKRNKKRTKKEAAGEKMGGGALPFHGDKVFSPTHKRTEGRAPVWGSEFTSKDAALQGGI